MIHSSKYRLIHIGYLALVLSVFSADVSATSDQTLISPIGAKSIGLGLGDAAPAIAYNSITNNYLVIYSKNDGSCSNERLFGIIVDAVSGNTEGSAFNISDCNNSIADIQIYFNGNLNEYLVFYKSIGNIGNKSNLYYCTINGTTNSIGTLPTVLIGDAIADPFLDLAISYDDQSNIYALGYHKTNAQSETSLTINYLNANSKSKNAYETFIDKDDFNYIGTNKGPVSTDLLFNGSEFVSVFELKLDSGSEIWGGLFNSTTGNRVNSFFQISPDAVSNKFYSNPNAKINAATNELITVYEQSYYAEASGVYILSDTIRIQKANASNGVLTSPTNVAISPLPGSGNTEDKKLPKIVISPVSNEIILSFYGIRFVAGDDVYNLYLHRLELSNLSSISSASILASSGIGKEVLDNGALKSLSLSYNAINNQFNIVWFIESSLGINNQIWRYDNNPPQNLSISSTSVNEEQPNGSTFAALSASDPDPEDTSPSFTLVSGTGSQDNSYFSIDGNAIDIEKRLSFEESGSRMIRIRATDSHGKSTEKPFVITINNINEEPFSLALSGSLSVAENTTPGSFTSAISIEDDDIGNTHTFSIVAGDSSDNNSNFNITPGSNTVVLTGTVNYEDTSRQYVRIRSTDNTGLSCEKAFTLTITDINEEPEQIVLSTNSLPENNQESTAIVDVIDPDSYSNYSFSKSSGEGDDDNGQFNLVDNELKPVAPLNYEVKNSYKVRLRAFDGTYDKTQSFIISVSDINDKPDSVRLSGSKILADQPNGSLVGYLIAYDQDANDSHIYSLINGTDFFFINGTEIRALNSMTYDYSIPENNIYRIAVQATDSQGEAKTENLTIEVVLFIDDEKPEIRNFYANDKYIDSASDSLLLLVDVIDNEQLETVKFYYRPIRSDMEFINGTELIKTTIFDSKFYNVVASLSTAEMDELGVEYYFKAFDASGNIDSTDVGYTYWSFSPKQFKAVNATSFNGTAESYKIIANPYLLESNKVSKIFADFGSSSNDAWRLFNFEGDENKEIGNVNGNSINQGFGYWFNKAQNLNQQIVFENARIHENNRQNPVVINLKKGWNLIGNPYPFKLDWEHVNTENKDVTGELDLYIFNKSYKDANSLSEFQGGFVFTDQAVALKIPVIESTTSDSRIAQNVPFENGWLVSFKLGNGDVFNELGGVGMHEQARESYDRFDRPLLPRFINYLDISFSHPEHFTKAFSQDIVELQENYIWEFIATTNLRNKNVTLSWDIDLFKRNENQLILYDVVRDNTIDIKNNSHYELVLNDPSTFKVIYGTQSFINESLSKIKIEALKPYPNPFSSQVSIPMNLPYSHQKYDIECSIYSLLGERVFEEKIEHLDHGLFQFEWNEAKNGKLERGIYIYSIKVKNGFLTNSFHGRIVKN